MAGNTNVRFPLFERAVEASVIDSGNALIVAPTATGKSYIGRMILRRAVAHGEGGTHAYLVPYRAISAACFRTIRTNLSCSAFSRS